MTIFMVCFARRVRVKQRPLIGRDGLFARHELVNQRPLPSQRSMPNR